MVSELENYLVAVSGNHRERTDEDVAVSSVNVSEGSRKIVASAWRQLKRQRSIIVPPSSRCNVAEDLF